MIKHIILALSVSLLAVACGGAPAEPAAPEGGGEAKPAEGAPADAKPAEGAPAGDTAAPAGDAAKPADAPK